MNGDFSPGLMTIGVLCAVAPRAVNERLVTLMVGSRVADALAACDAIQQFDVDQRDALTVSVWGRTVATDHCLAVGDRVELTRALRVDPKVARRERFAKQGAKGAGLFAKTRPGGKAGY